MPDSLHNIRDPHHRDPRGPAAHRHASPARPHDLLIDYGRAAEDYGRYRQGFPAELFTRLQKLKVGLPGQRLLDLGTGTGLMAREFARRGCLVTGADFSARLLGVAERTNAGEVVRPRYLRRRAESTKLPSASFDVVSAGTSWHLFHRVVAAREARRLLRPDGRLVIAHLDWHPAPGSVAAATLRLMARYGPEREAPVTFLWPAWAEELMAAGFSHWEIFGFTCTLHYTPEAWRGRVRASKRGAASMDKSELGKFDASLGRMLARRFPGPMLAVEHRVFAVVAC